MSVDKDTVRHIARLSRIAITDEQATAMVGELNGILDWVEQLQDVKTDDVEPLTSTVAMQLKRRTDEVTDGGYAERVTASAPQGEEGFFTVPKVVE